jgi:hypothetical protein
VVAVRINCVLLQQFRCSSTPLNPQRAGEAEAATARKPSCMPDFASMDDFKAYVGGGAAASRARGRAAWLGGAAAATAAAALLL